MNNISVLNVRKPLVFSDESQNVIHFFNRFAEVIDSSESEVQKLQGWIIKNVEIFKAGTYRGVTYSEDDLQQMVDNFKSLKSQGLFDPVFKKNHSELVEDQIGWILDARRDGEILLADLHLTEWAAYDKIVSGTWKNLSSEIYPPELSIEEFGLDGYVLRGVAIVSVPKVKGLKGLILNAEILEDEKGGDIVDKAQLLAMLAKLGINFSEEQAAALTVDQLEAALTAKFAEIKADPAVPGGDQTVITPAQFSEGQFVVMKQEDILALATKINEKNKNEIDLFAEVTKLKTESKKDKIERQVSALIASGKVTPAEKAEVLEFAEGLNEESLTKYINSLEKRTPVVTFGEEGSQTPGNEDDEETKQSLALFAEMHKPKLY